MPYKVTRYKCDFCRRTYARNSDAIKHEIICYLNPNRVPRDGELATFDTLPHELTSENSYGVANSSWLEPMNKEDDRLNLFELVYKWWPKKEDGELDLGFVWTNGKWVVIEGYKPPIFAPGHSWVDEVIPSGGY